MTGAEQTGPLTAARYSVLRERSASCAGRCPFAAPCPTPVSLYGCRSRVLLLRSYGAAPADEVQVAGDLLRDGFVVFSCREAFTAGSKPAAFFAIVCDGGPAANPAHDCVAA
jgi:hypothetical protein